jgi:hypothetical protein
MPGQVLKIMRHRPAAYKPATITLMPLVTMKQSRGCQMPTFGFAALANRYPNSCPGSDRRAPNPRPPLPATGVNPDTGTPTPPYLICLARILCHFSTHTVFVLAGEIPAGAPAGDGTRPQMISNQFSAEGLAEAGRLTDTP